MDGLQPFYRLAPDGSKIWLDDRTGQPINPSRVNARSHPAYGRNDRGQNTLRPVSPAPQPMAPLPAFVPAEDDGSPDAPPQWIVAGWLPVGRVTLLYANGGTGKTTAAQQLMTSCQTGLPWFDMPVTQCNTVALLSEDDVAEIRHRQHRINASLGIGMSDLGNACWLAGIGADNALVRFDRSGLCTPTQRFTQLRDAALANDARLVVIDAAAGCFGNGNENDRSHVAAFVTALTKLAMDIGGSVLLLAHPSRAGMATGTQDSGSTHWHNACRSRWSFVRPSVDGIEDDRSRILKLEKANWSQRGLKIKVYATNGLFTTSEPEQPGDAIWQKTPQSVFLDILRSCDAAGIAVSMAPSASNFGPKMFAKRPDANGITRRSFEAAMHSLLASGTLHVVQYGRPSKVCSKLAIRHPEADASEGP